MSDTDQPVTKVTLALTVTRFPYIRYIVAQIARAIYYRPVTIQIGQNMNKAPPKRTGC